MLTLTGTESMTPITTEPSGAAVSVGLNQGVKPVQFARANTRRERKRIFPARENNQYSSARKSVLSNTAQNVASSGLQGRSRPNAALVQGAVLGKRKEHARSESVKGQTAKRRKSPLPEERLCYECSKIRWGILDVWMDHDGRFDWTGKWVADVGKRYRHVSPSTTCPLCRQLSAPWIQSFVEAQYPNQYDDGDQIRIFRHLRHLPFVNDFPTANNALRKYNAPYHIAVVPVGRGWKDDLRKHIAKKGMVVVVPKSGLDSEVFVPQKVSPAFDPSVVLPWLRFCTHHQSLCSPKTPEVDGLKLIDCNSKNLVIREHHTDDKYVALSYVWGRSAQCEIPKATQAAQSTSAKEAAKEAAGSIRPPIPCSPSTMVSSVPGQGRKGEHQKANMKAKRSNCAPVVSHQAQPPLRLPKDIPQTIRDAIEVTKALGYRYLWVDQFCIDQSNEEEKQQQCSRMGDIYAGAQLTIFALGDNANCGLPGVSSRPRFWQQKRTSIDRFDLVSTMPDPHLCIQLSKWSTRGWTYQEGLFSTRRLFFTDFQVYFECNGMNCAESFKSKLKNLHIQNGRRLRAYHRAGKFVCGNSNPFSHVNIQQSTANHRKIDTIRRCQYQIRQYTQRELTDKDDVLNAFAGIARFYARSNARIASLAGIPIPFPIAKTEMSQEGLDHLSYALAWTHSICSLDSRKRSTSSNQDITRTYKPSPQTPYRYREPKRRDGYPSWSWAGWFGEVGKRDDLPYCWTSLLSSVKMVHRDGASDNYSSLQGCVRYKQYQIRNFLATRALHFDAPVLDPEKLQFWEQDPKDESKRVPSGLIHTHMSIGCLSLEEFHQKLMDKTFECLVLGTHGEPREKVMTAIRAADKKRPKSQKRRIDLFERLEPDAIVCLVVQTVDGVSERKGLLKVEFKDIPAHDALEKKVLYPKRQFKLV